MLIYQKAEQFQGIQMQILTWPLSRPERRAERGVSNSSRSVLTAVRRLCKPGPVEVKTASSSHYVVSIIAAMSSCRPSDSRMEVDFEDDDYEGPTAKAPLTTAGDERRGNPGGDDSRPPGDHYDESVPRKPPPKAPNDDEGEDDEDEDGEQLEEEEMEEEVEEDEEDSDDGEFPEMKKVQLALRNGGFNDRDLYNINGHQFLHSTKPLLIINLYGGAGQEGYTFSAYMPETEEEVARAFGESHLIPYSDTSLLDCINTETVPDVLVELLRQINGIQLIRNRGCVLCELRDWRRHPHSLPDLHEPSITYIVLRPNNQTLMADIERIVEESQADLEEAVEEAQGSSAPKRMRLDEEELSLDQRLELEKRLVKETAGGLCLDPSKQVGLIANRAQFEKFKWNDRDLRKTADRWDREKRRGEAIQRAQAEIDLDEPLAWSCSDDPDHYDREYLEASFRPKGSFVPFYKFVRKCVKSKKLKREAPREAIKLPPVRYVDYPALPPPTTPEEFAAITRPSEPASLRPLFSENYIKRTEEYILETERRKRPHRTRLTIYQRNGVESYYGELEQEAFADTPPEPYAALTNGPSPGGRTPAPIKPIALDPPQSPSPSSKCQFELGSSRSVGLYVKQFSDIFTEDGRRPCKIVYQKLGQPGPQTIYTSSYKALMVNGNNNNNPGSGGSSPAPPPGPSNVIISHNGAPPPPHSANAIIVSVPSLPPPPPVPATSSGITPPVQIVHPQPRPVPQPLQIFSSGGGTLVSMSPPVMAMTQSTSAAANLNLNLNLNSTRLVQQRQQLLTRPQIYNLNIGSQQQGAGSMTRPSSAPQLVQTQQNSLRMKQPTLATLLLTGLPNSNSKPITVAIQPQPQNHGQGQVQTIHINNSGLEHHQQHHSHNSSPIMIMVSPATANSLNSAQQNSMAPVGHHTGSVSVNLNAINLDGLLSVSSSGNSTNYVSSSVGHNSTANTLNILRLSNSTNTVTLQPQQLLRQNAQGQMAITTSGGRPDLEEISVPDLNSLLSNGPGRSSGPNYGRSPSNGTSIDLNLNLNLNLSGGHRGNGEVPNGSRNGGPGVNVNCVDSIFNALSDAIGPDLGSRLDSSVTSSMSPSSNPKNNSSPVITLNDLLGSPPMIPASSPLNHGHNHLGSPPAASPQSPSIVTSSSANSLAYATPRLSALLAGTPSADSSSVLVDSSSSSAAHYGNLLDRLMAQQPAGQRTGGSRLNPIATATPNVVLEHPMLAATLTQGTNQSLRQALTRPTAYRQIAPAPPPNLLQPQQQQQQQQQNQQQQQQQQQLINLLGLVGAANNSNQAAPRPPTLRMSGKPSAGTSSGR